MKFLVSSTLFLLILIPKISAQNDDYQREIKAKAQLNKIIELLKHDDINQLADYVKFPLGRKDPIPNIENKESFILYYPTLFDSSFKKILLDTMQIFSDMNVSQYTYWVGFHRGDLYLNENGLITVINYSSPTEENLMKALNSEAFSMMHSSITRCKLPLLVLKSETYLIRVDLMNDNSARYISWSTPKRISDKPDLILLNGTYEYQGNMGSIIYTFKNEDWSYIVDYRAICSDINECGYFLRLVQNEIKKKSIRLTRIKNNGL